MGYHENDYFNVGDRVRIKHVYRGKTWSTIKKRSGEWILQQFKTTNWVLRRPDDYTGYFTEGMLAKPYMLEKVEPKITSPTGHKSQDPPLQSVPPSIHVNDKKFVQKFVDEMVVKDDPHSLKDAAKKMIESDKQTGVFVWGTLGAGETKMKLYTDKVPVFKQLPPTHHWENHDTESTTLVPKIIVTRGSIVIVKNQDLGIPKGTLLLVSAGNEGGGASLTLIALFTGEMYFVDSAHVTVIPKQDLTITYLPQ